MFHAQGKVKLRSHKDAGGIERRATGYWGIPEGFRAISDPDLVPEWMRRSEIGTSIFCAGFRETNNWQWRMTYSLVASFFAAIERGEMVFVIDEGKIQINRNTLGALFDREETRSAAEETTHISELEFSAELYRCLTSPAASEKEVEIAGLGKVRIRILTDEGLSRRVGIVRNGMLITRSLEKFGHKLERFPSSREFVALVEPASDQASALLKTLENPAHNGFSAERISDPQKRAAARDAMKRFALAIREAIKAETAISQENETLLDELGRFFALHGQSDTPPDPASEDDPEKLVYKVPKKTRKKPKRTAPDEGVEGGQGGSGGSGGGTGSGRGTGSGIGTGGTGSRGEAKTTVLHDLRNTLKDDGGNGALWRTVHFTPSESGLTKVGFEATGINDSELLEIADASAGSVKDGRIEIDLEQGQRVSLEIRFSEQYAGPIAPVAMLQGQEATT